MGVIAGILWFVIARDTPEEHPLISSDEISKIRAGIGEVTKTNAVKAAIPWTSILRSRTLLVLTFSYFSFGYVAWIFLGWFYMYMAQARGLDLKVSSFYTMFPFLAMTVLCFGGRVLGDWITSRWGRRAGRCGPGFASLLLSGALLVIGARVASAPIAAMTLAEARVSSTSAKVRIGPSRPISPARMRVSSRR